jgi:hypothetical protein
VFLFCGYGLLSKAHPMSYVMLIVGALGVASAIYIIADLISPLSGVFVVSPEPLVDVLKVPRRRRRRAAAIGSCATPSLKGRYLARKCVRSCRLRA